MLAWTRLLSCGVSLAVVAVACEPAHTGSTHPLPSEADAALPGEDDAAQASASTSPAPTDASRDAAHTAVPPEALGDAGEPGEQRDAGEPGESRDAASPGEPRDANADAVVPTMVSDGSASPAACVPAQKLAAGDHDVMLDYQGHARHYRLHVPESYDGSAPIPLLLAIHGLTMDGLQMQLCTQFDVLAEQHGFAVVYPTSDSASWNARGCCNAGGPDDVSFMREVVAKVKQQICVDSARVYASGMSNGALLSHVLACEAADVFAAVAPVAAPLALPARCEPARPIAVMQVHGLHDTLVGYEGGGYVDFLVDPGSSIPGAEQSVSDWALRNMCSSMPSPPTDKSEWPTAPVSGGALPGSSGWVPDEIAALAVPLTPGASCRWHTRCADGVEVGLCTHDGQHDWPTGTSAAIWEFFARHRLP